MDMITQWKRLCELHSRTKHYLLIAEELSEEGDVFLQPMKEHRDAYDHIIRAFSADFRQDVPTDEEIDAYKMRNMNEAYSHEFRAFFDTADWLSFICRRYIRTTLRSQPKKALNDFARYQEIKEIVNAVPKKIADLRSRDKAFEKKDGVPVCVDGRVSEYCDILDELLDVYACVCNQFDNA